jgi:hypothetical protein
MPAQSSGAAAEHVTGELCFIAKIFLAVLAVETIVACPAQPRHADAFADFEATGDFTEFDHGADDFMAGNEGQLRLSEFAVDDMQVRATYGARKHANQDLPRTGRRPCPFNRAQRIADPFEKHRAHEPDTYLKH